MLDLPPPSKVATVEDVDETTVASSAAASSSKWSTGGIIYPPPDIRSIVDKTAAFVARNGTSFEAKIKGDERANTNFSFLNDSDAFNGYYRAKIEALRDGTGPLASAEAPGGSGVLAATSSSKEVPGEAKVPEQEEVPPEPQPFQFSADLPNITAVDLDTLKLTALFVARKGRAFAQALLAKEGQSYQFEFLRPNHSFFGFFNRLVEQYRLVIDPPADLLDTVRSSAGGQDVDGRGISRSGIGAGGARQHVLKQARQRAVWEKHAEQRRKKRADEEEQQKAAFAQIDWQDFVVVSTVEISDADSHIDLPVPMSLREVENMTLAQKRLAAMIMEEDAVGESEAMGEVGLVDLPSSSAGRPQADDDGEEMQMDESDDDEAQKPVAAAPTTAAKAAPTSQAKPPPSLKIRKDYVPKTLAERQRQAAEQSTTTCPVCGESIPTSEMDEHVRIELLNPKYREQRADLESRMAQQAALTQGADPARFLRSFAGARRDIFGLQEQEGSLAQKEEEERRKAKEREKIVWDGHAASKTRATGDFNRTEHLQATAKDLQNRFKAKDTESIGPQARPQDASSQSLPYPDPASGPPTSTADLTVGSESTSDPVAYNGVGAKRPATGEGVDGAQQPPQQRFAFEGPSGTASPAPPSAPSTMQGPPPPSAPTGPRQPYGYNGGYNHVQSPYSGSPAPAGASNASVLLRLPDGSKTVTYDDLPVATTTVASIRDRVQASEFPTIGASRIKLKLVRTGRVLNLKQTLAEVGVVPSVSGETTEQPDVIEVSVK
ncbi:unnamed protein product [Parajaminaea phylloscopi]